MILASFIVVVVSESTFCLLLFSSVGLLYTKLIAMLFDVSGKSRASFAGGESGGEEETAIATDERQTEFATYVLFAECLNPRL